MLKSWKDNQSAERGGVAGRLAGLLRKHGVITVILFLGFVMRFFLADRSYWYDELLSVQIYGIDQVSGFAAVKLLAERSIHPPLYQLILYYWMALFGDSEVATRTLSNLYVTGATLCLYILAFRLYGLRVAIAAAIIFSLIHASIFYALQTRSYAQTLFLVSLSSLLLFNFLRALPERLRWGSLLRDWRLLALIVANFALLLTHYYNILFFGAQGMFLLGYLLLKYRCDVASTTFKAAVVGAAPLILLLLTWAPVMAVSYGRMKSSFVVDTPTADAFSIFFGLVAKPNLAFPSLVLAVMSVLLLPRLALAGRSIYRGDAKLGAYFDFYFLFGAVMPCALAYLLFLIAGHERYSSRYFVFCAPPLAVLLVLSIQEAVRMIERLVSRLGFQETPYAMAVATFAMVLVVFPNGHRATITVKQDIRGIAEDIAALVSKLPESRYIIYEANHRPSLDYYFAKMKSGPRVHGVISTRGERSGEFLFQNQSDEIREHDYLVVAFTHFKTDRIPKALSRLKALYKLEHSVIMRGHGFMIFKTRYE